MKNKKNLVSKLLLCVGLLLTVSSIFCFFGTVLKMTDGSQVATFGSVFIFMFGGEAIVTSEFSGEIMESFVVKMTPVLTAVFVLVIIAILLVLLIIIGLFAKKLNTKKVKIVAGVISVLMLVSAILALTSKDAIFGAFGLYPELIEDYSKFSIGDGLVAFTIVGFASVAINAAGIVLRNKTK